MNLYQKLKKQEEAVIQSWERLQENVNRPYDLYGHDIGIHRVNMAIGGIIPTRVTVIGARSGVGKTAILCPMLEASLRKKSDGSRLEYLIFTWELDPSIVIDRAICSRVGLTLRQLNQGAKMLSEGAMRKIKDAYAVVSKFPVVYQMHSIDITHVRKIAKEFTEVCKEKSEIEGNKVQPVIVIDYIGMAMFEERGLRTYGIAEFMNGIKQFCNEERAAAIIFAQISRDTDKSGKIPDRADFSDSASIENACDNLIALHRPEYQNIETIYDPDSQTEISSKGKMLVRVLKGRDYGTGDFLINSDLKYFRFFDSSHQWGYEYWKDYHKPEFWMNEFDLSNINIM